MPIVSTMMGIGVMPMRPPVSGDDWEIRPQLYNRAVGEADLILLCGARVGDRAIAVPNQIAEQAKVIHIDIDPAEIGKNMRVDIPIVGISNPCSRSLQSRRSLRTAATGWTGCCGTRTSTSPGEDRMDAVEPRSFIRAPVPAHGRGRHPGGGPGQSQIWAAINFTQREGRVPHQRWAGNHGLRAARGAGGQAGEATASGGGCVRGQRFPDEPVQAGHGEGHQRPSENCGDGQPQAGNGAGVSEPGIPRAAYCHPYGGNPDFVALCRAYGIQAAPGGEQRPGGTSGGEMLASPGPYVLVCHVDPETPSV